MSNIPSPVPKTHGSSTDSMATQSLDELDLTSIEGLRQLQKGFILEEPRHVVVEILSDLPSVGCLTSVFPSILVSASRADRNLEWQLAALDTLSIWLLRASRSRNPAQISLQITPSEWETLISLTWTRWASAPNSNAIQKVLKEIFSKTLHLQRILYGDWKGRETQLLERVANMKGIDMKIYCYLAEVLVRRASHGAKKILELRNNWVMDMLAYMKDGGNGPAVGKCLVGVLMVRRTELIENDPEVPCLLF